MIKAIICRIVYVVTLLTWQVSGTFHPLSSVNSITSTATGRIGSRRVQEYDTTQPNDHDKRSVASILKIRGGGAGSVISNLNDYIGASKSRSWAVLIISVLIDTAAVTLMKTAQAESSAQKLVLSFFGLFLR